MPTPDIYVTSGGPHGRWSRFLAYRRLWWIAAIVFVLDRVSKQWILSILPYNPYHEHSEELHREIIPGFFYLIHIGNTGAAWSILSGKSGLLALLAVVTLLALYRWRHDIGLRKPLAQIGFGLACGGIVGNLFDRVVYGHVIDFVDLHFGHYVYPTFNVADSGICIGVILYLWLTWREPSGPG